MRTKPRSAMTRLLRIMARLRGPGGCPWDHAQTHRSLRYHAVEEVYELLDAIEAGDDRALEEELGDLLLQIVFHAQMAKERGVFDFEAVARRLADKLVHRHPHVFGRARVNGAAGVVQQWDELKRAEQHGSGRERASALDGIPRHLPALLRAEKLVKKARKAGLLEDAPMPRGLSKTELGRQLFTLARLAQQRRWSAEDLLRAESRRVERALRRAEAQRANAPAGRAPSAPRSRGRARGA